MSKGSGSPRTGKSPRELAAQRNRSKAKASQGKTEALADAKKQLQAKALADAKKQAQAKTADKISMSSIYKKDSSWDSIVYSRSNGNVDAVKNRPSSVDEFKASFLQKIKPQEGVQNIGGIKVTVKKEVIKSGSDNYTQFLVEKIGNKKIVTTSDGGGYSPDNAVEVKGFIWSGRLFERPLATKGWK